jgi:L-amino acid N-acyltransferase YncA
MWLLEMAFRSLVMKVIRCQNMAVLPLLEPLILEDPDYDRAWTLQMLAQGLKLNYPTFGVYIVLDDAESEIIAFAIMEAQPGSKFVWVYQTWVHAEKGGRKAGDLLMSRMIEFTRHCGKHALRAETRRNTKAFERSRNFVHVSSIIEYNVFDTTHDLFLAMENNNGQRKQEQQTVRPERTDEATEELDGSGIRVSDGTSESGGGSQLRSTREGSDGSAIERDSNRDKDKPAVDAADISQPCAE